MAGGQLPPGAYQSVSETWNGTSWTEGNNIITAGRSLNGIVGTTTAALCIVGYTTTGVNQVESYNGTSWSETSTDTNTAKCCVGGKGTSTDAIILVENRLLN